MTLLTYMRQPLTIFYIFNQVAEVQQAAEVFHLAGQLPRPVRVPAAFRAQVKVFLPLPHTQACASTASDSADNTRTRADTMPCARDRMRGNRIHSSNTHIYSGMWDCTSRNLPRERDLPHRN